MIDIETVNENWIMGNWEDFDGFVANEQWSDCEALIENVGDHGYTNDAIRMNHVLNKAKGLGYLEPVSQENIPTLKPEETDEEVLGVFNEWRDDQYDKN